MQTIKSTQQYIDTVEANKNVTALGGLTVGITIKIFDK